MPFTINLAGRTALVTGASSGLGAHFARTLANAGAQLILAARRKDALDRLAEEIEHVGGAAQTIEMDVQDADNVAEAFRDLRRFDILVNNAGVVRQAPALDVTDEDWDVVLGTNLRGMFLVAREAGRKMRQTGGSIVNIASILGIRQASGVLPYAVSKAGVIQMTKSLALELARHGIRVNALAPGYIATDLNGEFWESEGGRSMIRRIPMRRLGQMADLDLPLLMLASEQAGYCTGSVITVDGGHLVSGL